MDFIILQLLGVFQFFVNLIWDFYAFGFALGSKYVTYRLEGICRIKHFILEREDTLSKQTQVKQVIYKWGHEFELWHH